jgi:hypothetical protein
VGTASSSPEVNAPHRADRGPGDSQVAPRARPLNSHLPVKQQGPSLPRVTRRTEPVVLRPRRDHTLDVSAALPGSA